FGLMVPQIDMAAHAGGLAAGFVCGLALSQPLTRESRAGRAARNLRVAVCGALLLAAAPLIILGRSNDFPTEFFRFAEVAEKVQTTSNTTLQQVERGERSQEDLADVLEREVLPPWRDSRARLASVKQVAPDQKQLAADLDQYMGLRQESWELLAQSIREGDR